MINLSKTKEQILLTDGSVLDFILDVGNRKNLYISIKDGQVLLKIPYGYSKEKAYDFLLSKSDWIKKALAKQTPNFGFKTYENGEKVKLLGKEYTLRLIESNKFFAPYFSENEIIVSINKSINQERIAYYINKLLLDFATREIECSCKKLCQITGLYPKKVSIKQMKSRWGSCSSNDNISINYDIIYHDRECLEYVIIHELCHLKYMNHSKDFWDLVEKYCPDRKRIRKLLNQP